MRRRADSCLADACLWRAQPSNINTLEVGSTWFFISWLAPYDGGSTILFYELEVNEYFFNSYIVYDESRCNVTEPEPEPEPTPDYGRRRAQEAVSVWCSKGSDGEYVCAEDKSRRRAQDEEVNSTEWQERAELRLVLPLDAAAMPADFEETLVAELESIAGLFAQTWQTNNPPSACSTHVKIDAETGGETPYTTISVAQAQASIIAICEEGARLGLTPSFLTSVGPMGYGGVFESGGTCTFTADLCTITGGGTSPCTTKVCQITGKEARFSVTTITAIVEEEAEEEDSGRRRAQSTEVEVIVNVEPSADESAVTPIALVQQIVDSFASGGSLATGGAGSFSSQFALMNLPGVNATVLIVIPEPEPEPAPEPDPDGTITRTTIVVDAGGVPSNWNMTLSNIAAALGIRMVCADSLSIGCVESHQFGVSSVSIVILEGEMDLEKVDIFILRSTIATMFPGFNVTDWETDNIYIDTSGPVIGMVGSNPTYLDMYSKYIEKGAAAFDNMDGDVTSKLSISGSVNMEVAGTYTITYSVTDVSKNRGLAARSVIVVDQFLFRQGMPRAPHAMANESCDFNRTVTEEGYLESTGRDGRRYARATRPTKTWEWPYAIPQSYYTSNLRSNRTYRIRTRGISAVGSGMWSDVYILKTSFGKDVLQGEHIFGCQDPIALNYNSRATYGDGSCTFELPDGPTLDEMNRTRDAVHGWDGDDGSIFVVGGTRNHPQWGFNFSTNETYGVESGRDDYTDYPTFHNPTAGGGPGEGIEGLQQIGREARQRGDFTTDADTPGHGPWETWGGNPNTTTHTANFTGPAGTVTDGGNIHTVFDTVNKQPTTSWGTTSTPGSTYLMSVPGGTYYIGATTDPIPPHDLEYGTGPADGIPGLASPGTTTSPGGLGFAGDITGDNVGVQRLGTNYGDQLGPGPEAWNTGGDALSAEQAFAMAAELRAESIQQMLRDTRSDDTYRLVHGEPWGHRPGYGGKLGGGDPDLDLGAAEASGTFTHPTGIPRRLRDPEYRMYHGMAVRGLKQAWHHNLTAFDIADYKSFDVDIVRLGFQWNKDNPDWNMLGKRYMTFRACVQSLNATALNSSWVDGYENVSTHLDRVAGPEYKQGPYGYGDIADIGLLLDDPIDPYDPFGPKSDRLMDGLIGGHGTGPTKYTDRWAHGPDQSAPEPEPDGFGFTFIPGVDGSVIEPIMHGLLQPFTSCDESTVTIHIRVEGWGEDVFWQVDGGTVYGPYPNVPGHYYEALFLTAGEHNITYWDSKGNGWCNPTPMMEGPDGMGPMPTVDPPLHSFETHCGYWDVGDDTGRVLAGGPIAGIVHGRGDWHTFFVPSRCASGTEIGEGSRAGHRVSSAWNITEYNELMWYCQERVYINCTETPQNCTFYLNDTTGEWVKPPTGIYEDDMNPSDQPIDEETGRPINFLMDDAQVSGFDFAPILEPQQGPEWTNRPYDDSRPAMNDFTGADLPMYDPRLGAIPEIAPEMGAQPNHRIDPLQPTSVIPPGDDPSLRPSSHGVRGGPRPSYNSDHHVGTAFESRPLVPYENEGLWPGSRSGLSVNYDVYRTGRGQDGDRTGSDGDYDRYRTGLHYADDQSYTGAGPANNEAYRLGYDTGTTAYREPVLSADEISLRGTFSDYDPAAETGSQIHFGDNLIGGIDRTGKRRAQAVEVLERRMNHMTEEQRKHARMAAIGHQTAKFSRGASAKRQLQMSVESAERGSYLGGSDQNLRNTPSEDSDRSTWRWVPLVPPPEPTVDSFIRRRQYIPDSVFNGQIWPVNTYGYRPKATPWPPNPGLTDFDLVGLKNYDSEMTSDSAWGIPDELRANEENAGFYEIPYTWHGVNDGATVDGVASPQTTTNPWWMDDWPSGGQPSQDQPRDMTIERMLVANRGRGVNSGSGGGGEGVMDSIIWGAAGAGYGGGGSGGRNRPGEFYGHDGNYTSGDRGDSTRVGGTPGDQFQGGEARLWVGAWPTDGTGYDADLITGWPAADYVDPSQNSEYSDRLDARVDEMYGAIGGAVDEAQQGVDAWMDQMYVRDMAFEDMMEARRNAERKRLADEAELLAISRARKAAEQLARKRGKGLRTHEWDWIDDADVGPDGPAMDPLFCHGLTYEQCNWKVYRQDFLAIEGTPVNMTEYLFANNLTANYSEYMYLGQEWFVTQVSDEPSLPYGALDPPELQVFIGDTVHFDWIMYENVHVAYYFEDVEASCVGISADLPLCPGMDLCDRTLNPTYWDSGDRFGGGGLPAAVQAGSHTQAFPLLTQAGTYCIGSQGVSGEMKMTLHVEIHPCDITKVGRGSPCDPPMPDPLCNATLNRATHPKWQTLSGLQQYKLMYIWSQNFTHWDNSVILPEHHGGKFTGFNTIMPLESIASFSTEGEFGQEVWKEPGFIYNATRLNATYVNYTTIGGYINYTSRNALGELDNKFVEEEYVNGTWLNETWICEDQVTLIPDRQPCWSGYFKRQTNTGIHDGHAKGESYVCLQPSNVYDTVPPYYFDQLNEWKDQQLMYPPVIWELVETFEEKGIKVILDGREKMEDGGKRNPEAGETGTDPLCGYGVEGSFQPESDIYACFIPSSDSRNNRNRFGPGDWNRENWGYDPVPMGKDDKGTNPYPKWQGDISVPHRPPRKRAHPLVKPYAYPREVTRGQPFVQSQAYYPNLDNVDPLYIPGTGVEPTYYSKEQQDIVTGGPHVNPHGSWGSRFDDESYTDNPPGSTPLEIDSEHRNIMTIEGR